jgi:4-carboxymuconolactone decarboxylase
MARIPRATGGPMARLAFWFTRRQFARLTGRTPEQAVEPLELFAHVPGLLRGYGKLEQATARLHGLDRRADALAELRAATVVRCEFCIDLASQVARRWGLSDDELRALPSYRTSDLFDDRDRLVLDYATAMSRTPVQVPDELVAALREHFTDAQLVQLTFVIALENLRGRFNTALGVEAAGFSEGMVCAVPVD